MGIARRHLLPRRLEANGLRPDQLEITDEAVQEIVRHYTREAGCRNLERELGPSAAASRCGSRRAGPHRLRTSGSNAEDSG